MRASAAIIFLLFFSAPLLRADDVLIPREHHEWGRFPLGSWKKVRVVTEKLDGEGKVVSSSGNEVTTTVVAVHANSVELRVESIVEVAGKQFNQQPQIVRQGFEGAVNPEVEENERVIKSDGKSEVVIDGQTVESEVKTVTVRRDTCRWTSRIYYSQNIAPYVLRREIISRDPSGRQTHYETSVEVTAIDMPHEVDGVIRPTSHVRTTTTTPKGKTVTLEVRCEDVPGGFISHTSKELDNQGRLIGRSTLQLLEYHVPKRQQRPVMQRTWQWNSRWGR